MFAGTNPTPGDCAVLNDGCTPSETPNADFPFLTLTKCMDCKVTEISPLSTTINDKETPTIITIAGENFPSDKECGDVKFGMLNVK